jgi:FtsH-binding integral membrane protein
MIIGGKRYDFLTYDDYILGAIMLYVDIVGLFIYILELIGGK